MPLLEMVAVRTLWVLRDQKRRSIFIKSWDSLEDMHHGATKTKDFVDLHLCRVTTEARQVGNLHGFTSTYADS